MNNGYWIFGIHAVEETLKAKPSRAQKIWVERGKEGDFLQMKSTRGARDGSRGQHGITWNGAELRYGTHQILTSNAISVHDQAMPALRSRWTGYANEDD